MEQKFAAHGFASLQHEEMMSPCMGTSGKISMNHVTSITVFGIKFQELKTM